MIKKVTMYACFCDECGKQLREDDKVAWEEHDAVELIAEESGWTDGFNGSYFCPECMDKIEDNE